MSQNQKKKFNLVQFLVMALYLLACMGVGVLFGRFISTNVSGGTGEALFSFAVLMVGMYVGLFAQIAIHEAGHLVFGLLSGYSFSSYRIFSLMWIKENGKIRLRRYSLAGTGGQCLMVPPEMVDGKCPTVLYNLGGVILNVITGVIFILIALALGESSAVGLLLLTAGILGFAFALLNGIPMHAGSVDNDGYNAWSLRKDPQAMRAFWVQMKINERITMGVRLKDMPQEWFQVPSDDEMKNSITATLGVFACNRLMDEHRFSEAQSLITRLMDMETGIIGMYRDMMICDRIFCHLMIGGDEEILGSMENKEFKKFCKAMKLFPTVIRTEYVYALLHKRNQEESVQAMERFERCAKTYPHPSELESERELMELAREKECQSC